MLKKESKSEAPRADNGQNDDNDEDDESEDDLFFGNNAQENEAGAQPQEAKTEGFGGSKQN